MLLCFLVLYSLKFFKYEQITSHESRIKQIFVEIEKVLKNYH
jgi:hypothetical protein